MNSENLNAIALNGRFSPSVFSVVQGSVQCRGQAVSRRYTGVVVQGVARHQALVWSARVRRATGVAASDGVLGVLGQAQARRVVRWLQTDASPMQGGVRLTGLGVAARRRAHGVQGGVAVAASISTGVRRHMPVQAHAQVLAVVHPGVGRGAQMAGVLQALVQANPHVVPRRLVRQWVHGHVVVQGQAQSRVRRLAQQRQGGIHLHAQAQAAVMRSGRSRGQIWLQSQAMSLQIHPRASFDEHAPLQRCFEVPFGASFFEVT